jgi:hypothetical protein
MTVTAAPTTPRRAVLDLGAEATILDAAARLDATNTGQDVALVVAAGAPLARNAVFLDVLRRRAADRRLALVSSDARARSLAASVHVPAFASLAALERHELDATEHLGEARRAALATIAAIGPRRTGSLRRSAAVLASLLVAAAVLAAVVAPSATVVVTPSATTIGPYEYDLTAGPRGDINDALTQGPSTLSKTFSSPATGSKVVDVKATGVEKFTNLTTNDIRIPKGTVVSTPDGIRFQTTEDNVLGRSLLRPILFTSITINIVALEPGTRGNVGQDRITSGSSSEYSVTNPVATAGGDYKTVAVVMQGDYDKAVAAADDALRAEANATLLKRWQQDAPKGRTVYGTYIQRSGITPASDVVGKTLDFGTTFDLTATGTAVGYSVPSSEPRQTALKNLAENASPGNQISSGDAAKVETVTGPIVDANGVHWRVRVSSIQYARTALLTSAIAGRSFEDATRIAGERGFKVIRIAATPEWLPRMPLLDSRIAITIGEPTITTGGS